MQELKNGQIYLGSYNNRIEENSMKIQRKKFKT